ncbi:MAG TPA: ABC transporter substrate-binding protein [Chloroflexota bacterium]|nr:ABC transporter substrate-binding protein [Chloroflexota bacterium]
MQSALYAASGVLLAVLLAACSSGAAPASKPSAPAAPAAAAPTRAVPTSGPARPAPSAPATPPPVEHIKVSFAADSAIYAPHFIALEKGYYQEEGIDMEMIRAGGGAATPALISGEIQYSTSAATSLSAMLKGAPLKVIYTNSDRSFDELWTTTDGIRTLQDLVGKSIGIQTRGDTMEIESRLMLMKYGIDPNTVSFNAMGVGNQRLAALEAGVIPAAVLSIPDAVLLKETGAAARAYRVADFRNEIQMLYTGLATSDQELRGHQDRARRFLRGTVKGREYFKLFKDETLAIMEKYNGNPRPVNEADYDATLPALTEDGSMPAEVQRQDAIVRAQVNDVDQVPPVEQMYDYSLVKDIYRELHASGWKPTR